MANCKSVITLCEDNFTVCGDVGLNINDMMSTPISGLTSLKEFKDTMVSELIDAKHWKTQSNYPTLRLVYDRYMNSTDYCDTLSSQFDYCDMLQFSELVGTYWVDLIEQVVPATTIWGSTYVYGNTLWDQQKFTYKKYSLFTCDLPEYCGDVVSPVNGWEDDVEVEWETLPNDEYYNKVSGSTTGETFTQVKYVPRKSSRTRLIEEEPKDTLCMGVGIIQTNCGSEFIGRLVDYSNPHSCPEPTTGSTEAPITGTTEIVTTKTPITGDITIVECSITVQLTDYFVSDGNNQMTANIGGDVIGPITYLWSDGQTTQTATNLVAGQTYSVIATDNGIDGCSANSNAITIPEVGLAIGDCAHGGFVFYLDDNGGGLIAAFNDATGATGCNIYYYRGDDSINIPHNITGPNIGDGQQNTTNLVDLFPIPHQTFAAGLANDYVNTDGSCGGVYNDWYLPSSDELDTMRINLSSVGSLDGDFNFVSQTDAFSCDGANYWSSTINLGVGNVNTMVTDFGGPYTINQNTNKAYVRAIRKF